MMRPMAAHRPSRLRSAAERSAAFSLAKACSIGLKSGLQGWQMAPQQLFTWRREARVASASGAVSFVRIVPEPPAPGMASAGAVLEVLLAGAVVRVSPGVDPALLTTVLRAVRASGS